MFSFSCIMQAKLKTPVSGLLISWATPAASRPTEASFSLRPSCWLVDPFEPLLALGHGVGHAVDGPAERPISPWPDAHAADRSPAIIRFDMATIAPMGRSTAVVTRRSAPGWPRRATMTIARKTPMITRSWCTNGAWSRPTERTPMICPVGIADRSVGGEVPVVDDQRRSGPGLPPANAFSPTAALSCVPIARPPSSVMAVVESARHPGRWSRRRPVYRCKPHFQKPVAGWRRPSRNAG